MGVGRNLAYTRGTFQRTKGFASHMRRLSGDDDLLVQDAVALGARAAVVADPPAHTLSQPAETWAAWWRQKRRHLSAGSRYRAGRPPPPGPVHGRATGFLPSDAGRFGSGLDP
ncbi:MAG: hypothetical protein WKG07_07700 [Hymenobacter sp.]